MIVADLQTKLIKSLKEKDVAMASVIRFLMAGIKNKEIELRPLKKEMTDLEVLSVLKKQIKKREECILEYAAAKRDDLVTKESAEVAILKDFLKQYDVAGN